MKPQDVFDEHILGRHEKQITGSDLEKLSFKEEVFRVSCEIKERIRDTIVAKRKRQSAKVLARTLRQLLHQKILEEKRAQHRSLVKENVRLTAKIHTGKITSDSNELSNISEEGYYILMVVFEMRKKQLNGKQRKRIEETEEKFRKTMRERGYATEMKEIKDLVLLIPEEERESITKRLVQLKVI